MKRRLFLLSLILLAFFLRVWHLPQTPPGLWYDEAYYAMDAAWMGETGHYPLFFVGNNGREPLWPYLLLVSISLLGHTTFAVRWMGALIGVLTIPLMYCLAMRLLRPFARRRSYPDAGYTSAPQQKPKPRNLERQLLALTATGWLTVSWWHLLNSRAGFRTILLPPILILSVYFFWRAWQDHVSEPNASYRRFTNFTLAGLFLGLSQYTYLSARLAPLIFGGLVGVWTLQTWLATRSKQAESKPGLTLKQLWLGLLWMAVIAVIVFAPLGLFFLNHPGVFSSRTGDVIFLPDHLSGLVVHLLQGLTFFLGAGHELYRHHLPGRAMLGWLEIPFFWLGLVVALRAAYRRCPEAQMILLGLTVMWLPTLLASPPVHSLRPIGLLPFYYLLVTLGLYWLARRFSEWAHSRWPVADGEVSRITYHVSLVILVIVIALNGLINSYDYFWRWANHPEVYRENNGPLVDLTYYLINLTETNDVLIPFYLYVHPTTRYLLDRIFPEVDGPPPETGRPVAMMLVPNVFELLYVGNIPASPALALLTRNEAGRGAIYVSRPPRAAERIELEALITAHESTRQPFKDRLGRTVAQFITLPSLNPVEANSVENKPIAANQVKDNEATTPDMGTISALFNATPLRTINLTWANLAQLKGYEVTPELVQPGQPLTLNLYWHSLTDDTFNYRLFLQLIDGAGHPINQWEGEAFREDMYRWRPNGLLPTQHTLWAGPETPPGPYLIRLGFFDESSGQRLPLQIGEPSPQSIEAGAAPIDQVQLGLFYVTPPGVDPRLPATPLAATFADTIKLVGVTLPEIQSSILNPQSSTLSTTFHWHTLHPTSKPYTVFLQLLNEQGEVVSGWDSQPFNGLYPTNLWSPGEIIVDTFRLPLPEGGLPPGVYRLITGFYDVENGQRLPVTTTAGSPDFVELKEFGVK